MTAKETADFLPLSWMERLKTLDPRRKMEGRSSKACTLHRRPILGLSAKLQLGWWGHRGTTVNDGQLSPTPTGECGGPRRGFRAKPQNPRSHGAAATASPQAIDIREATVERQGQICLGTTKPQMGRCRRGGGTVTSRWPSRTVGRDSNGARATDSGRRGESPDGTVLPPWQHRGQSSSFGNARSSSAAVAGFTSSLRWT
jgi:hypothetical protein